MDTKIKLLYKDNLLQNRKKLIKEKCSRYWQGAGRREKQKGENHAMCFLI